MNGGKEYFFVPLYFLQLMLYRKEPVQQVQQMQNTSTVSTTSNNPFPSNLVVVKTASGKNIVLKVISQTKEVSMCFFSIKTSLNKIITIATVNELFEELVFLLLCIK